MEAHERDLITTLLTRLQSAQGQPKDAEADALIRQAMTQIPDAPYYLVQTVLIQDLSMQSAQSRIADLEKQVTALQAPPQKTSFLGGLFGGGSQAPAPASAPPAGPWTRSPQVAAAPPPGYAQQGYGQQQPGYAPQQQGYAPQQQGGGGGMFGGAGGGGGFLRQAAATAAGVAGGALLFQGISSLFGHGYANSLGGGFGGAGTPGLGETVVNNYYGDQGGGDYGGGGGDYGGGGGGDYAGGGDYGGGGGGDYGGGGGDYGGGGGGDDYGGGGDSGDYGGGGSDVSC
jgi:hypothetical protein